MKCEVWDVKCEPRGTLGQIVGPRGLGWSSGSVFKRFLGASGVPPGALLATFFGFSRHGFPAKFRIRFWKVFSRFRVAFGLLRASFSRAFGGAQLWQKQYPRLHGSYVFGVSSGQKLGFFRHRFRMGSRRRFFRLSGVFWAPLGHPAAPLWAPWGPYFADGFRRDFGCQNDGFRVLPPKGENRSSERGWPRARRENLLWP